MDATHLYQQVQTHYGSCARDSVAGKGSSSRHSEQVAKAFGYSEEELVGLPEGANLGLSCGNPLAVAGLRGVGCVIFFGVGSHAGRGGRGRRWSLCVRGERGLRWKKLLLTDGVCVVGRDGGGSGQWGWVRCVPCGEEGRGAGEGDWG